jgi:hypothetical protein
MRDQGTSHGVVVVARRPRPTVILIGATATATYGCAQKAANLNEGFPDPEHAIIAHVQSRVTLDKSLPGPEKRKLEDAKVMSVRKWHCARRAWVHERAKT